MEWIVRVELAHHPDQDLRSETLSSLLWDLGTIGLAETPSSQVEHAGCAVVAGFRNHAAADAARGALDRHRATLGINRATTAPVDDGDWVDESRVVHVQVDGATVELAVGAAFGHGDHPTTRLCLELLTAAVAPGAVVLDFGTGTGILAIAALDVGAARVAAIENDQPSLAIARTNLTRAIDALGGPSSGPKVTVAERLDDADVQFDRPFDLVVANVLASAHAEYGPSLAPLVGPGGGAIISGVLASQREATIAAYRPMVVADERRDGDWLGLELRAVTETRATGTPAPSGAPTR